MGCIYICTGILCFVYIREPVDIEKKEGSVCSQMKELTTNVCKAIKKNPNLVMGWILLTLFGCPKIIEEVYFMSWLNSEVTNGHFPDEDAKAHFYEKSITMGYIFLLIFIPFYSWLIDKVSMKISTIVGLAIRATLFYLAYRIEDPETQKAYFFTVVPLL